jgi:hypothetical protein
MGLSWNEIKSRALLFSNTWGDAIEQVAQVAQAVLDARAQFADASLADLYEPLTMPPAQAHQKLDTALDAAYQPSGGKKTYASDAERVAFLFELYQRITSFLTAAVAKKTRITKSTEI